MDSGRAGVAVAAEMGGDAGLERDVTRVPMVNVVGVVSGAGQGGARQVLVLLQMRGS
jgi:hypothetical protein